MPSRMRRLLAVPVSLVLCACGTVANKATNLPLAADAPPVMAASVDVGGEYTIGLSFSGGGMRAAAFSYGVLEALRGVKRPDGDALQEVSFITSVSGGSLTAAHFGAFGREGLARFREEVLQRDFQQHMRITLNPVNLIRMISGGMNSNAEFRDRLDREVFRGATFKDILDRGRPDIRISATDIYNRIAFPFIPRAFSIICSDIRSYKVADAVAASMAVPLLFSPVVLKTYPDSCREPVPETIPRLRDDPHASRLLKATSAVLGSYRDPRAHYVKLADGGLTDNFGLTTLLVTRAVMGTPYAPMTPRDAVRARRVLFIVIDGAEGAAGVIDLEEGGPSGFDVALHASAAAVDSSARLAADAFSKALKDWQDSIVAYRCGLTRSEARALGASDAWQCNDMRFTLAFLSIDSLAEPHRSRIAKIPTRLSLSSAELEAIVEGARAGTVRLPQLLEYLSDR